MGDDLLSAIFQNTKQIRKVTDSIAYLGWCYDIHANRFEEGRKYLLAVKQDLGNDIYITVGMWNGMYFDSYSETESVVHFSEDGDVRLDFVVGFIPIDTLKYVFDYTKIKRR